MSLDATTPIDAQGGASWGQFTSQVLRSVTLHPSGYIAALNGDYSKIEVLRLRSPSTSDATARRANLLSGQGSQRGNVDGARAVAATHDGLSFLVLEDHPNRRIQALDEHCNPVLYFLPAGAKTKTCFAPLKDEGSTPVTYLDLSVAVTGYVYVLSYANDGHAVDDFRLDLYEKNGDWMARTTGLAAARMVVDHWQNAFALNYERIVGPGNRAEPSVSQWVPST